MDSFCENQSQFKSILLELHLGDFIVEMERREHEAQKNQEVDTHHQKRSKPKVLGEQIYWEHWSDELEEEGGRNQRSGEPPYQLEYEQPNDLAGFVDLVLSDTPYNETCSDF